MAERRSSLVSPPSLPSRAASASASAASASAIGTGTGTSGSAMDAIRLTPVRIARNDDQDSDSDEYLDRSGAGMQKTRSLNKSKGGSDALTRWAKEVIEQTPQRHPVLVPPWADMVQATEMRAGLESKFKRDQHRLKAMISQRVHKTQAGRRLATMHLPCKLEDDLHRYRREDLEKLNLKSRRIQYALNDSAKQRQDLRATAQRLANIQREEDEGRRANKELEKLGIGRALGAQMGPRDRMPDLDKNAVNKFSTTDLDPGAQEVRELARRYEVPVPDLEVLRSVFDQFDMDGKGVVRADFFDMIKAFGKATEDINEMAAGKLWKQLDRDGNHRVDFEEYLIFHLGTLPMPRLSHLRGSYSKQNMKRGSFTMSKQGSMRNGSKADAAQGTQRRASFSQAPGDEGAAA
mmetsp:Transcript_59372/g.174266  ORF Transcript_59372/g.174266 Transcript_59372/m.174266 type:complete len:406 (+) Transcript_59372:3-1220(+)